MHKGDTGKVYSFDDGTNSTLASKLIEIDESMINASCVLTNINKGQVSLERDFCEKEEYFLCKIILDRINMPGKFYSVFSSCIWIVWDVHREVVELSAALQR